MRHLDSLKFMHFLLVSDLDNRVVLENAGLYYSDMKTKTCGSETLKKP